MFRKLIYLVSFILVLNLALVSGAKAADPNLVGMWPLNEGSGDTAIDLSGNGNDGTINNADIGGLGDGGSVWVDDPERGTVISFNGTADSAFVRAGNIPQMTLTNDFTWSFWAKHSEENTADNDIILGNRMDESAVDFVPRQFIKFTPTKFEWHMNGNGDDNLDYDDIPADIWLHHAVVKTAEQLTYYRNGIEGGSGTITQPLDFPQPLYFGGDNEGADGENWSGLMSDVSIYDRALSADEIGQLAGTPVDPGTDGLVAYYALENDVLDSSGNGNDGTIVGAPTFVDGPEDYGMAMEFDGESYVDVGNDASLDITGPISMGIWIRPSADDPEGNGTEAAVMAKADSAGSPSWSWQVRYGWNSPQPYMAFTFNTSPRAWAYVGKNLERDEWAHIACSHDGTTLKCYLNGEETDSTPMGAITSSPTPVLIGSDGWRSDWIGAIDEVVIYDRALSESEVMYLAGKRATPVDPGTYGLVAFYALDNDANDSSGNELHGTIVGDPSFVEGQVGMALELDGVDDYVDSGNPPELAITEAISIACWVNPTGFVGRQSFVGLDTGYVFKVHEQGRLCFTTPGVADHESANTILEAGVWQHVAATFLPGQDDGLVFYLNGVETERMASSGINTGSGPFRIGNNQWSELLTGLIDEVIIYNRILSTGEIRYLAGERAAPDVEANKEVARRFFEEMWNLSDLDIVEELITADMQGHAPTGEFVGYEGERQTILGTLEAFPDLQITIDSMIAEGDRVSLRTSYQGTHTGTLMGQIPATGQSISMTGNIIFRFEDGKVAEAWSFADMLGLMQQIGAASPARPAPEDYTWDTPLEVIGDPGDPETNKSLISRFVEEVWNQQKLDVMDEIFSQDVVSHNPPIEHLYGPSNLDVLKEGVTDYLTAYPDLHVVLNDLVAEGDLVSGRWLLTGTHTGELMGIPATGNAVNFEGITLYRFTDGKIVEMWWAWDTMGMMQQITPAAP